MSVFARRPCVKLAVVQPAFTRGVRIPRRSVGDDVNTWLNGPGNNFKEVTDGPKWLGKDHPFPMNPSFKPPPAIADTTKEAIWQLFMEDPERHNVRILSSLYGISVKRVDAILRLKGMEKNWFRGKELHTGFRVGMERLLRPVELVRARGYNDVPATRKDMTDADKQDEEEVNDHARDRYQRLFWEPVAENEEPIVPRSLEQAKEEARVVRREAMEAKSDAKLLTGREVKRGPPTLPKEKPIVVRSAPDRPATVFKDVGGRFLEVEDRLRRMHGSARRKQAKLRRRSSSP